MRECSNVVILHGWDLSAAYYNKLSAMLKRSGFKVYTPDLPGFGRNKILNKPFVFDDYVSFVKEYIEKNKLEKVILIGHSFGGRISIKLVANYPEKIEMLILTGVPGFAPVARGKVIFFLILSKIGKIIFALPMFNKLQNICRKILYRLAGSSDYLKTKGVMRDTFKSIIREDLLSSMKKIRVKTLLVWGELDKVVPLSIACKMQKNIKGSKLMVAEDETHKLPYENSEKFFEVIKEYI